MSNESAVVANGPVVAPVPPAVVSPPPTTPEQAEAILAESVKARVLACQRDIQAALAKHGCDLSAFPVAECGGDGITRHRAIVQVVPL